MGVGRSPVNCAESFLKSIELFPKAQNIGLNRSRDLLPFLSGKDQDHWFSIVSGMLISFPNIE